MHYSILLISILLIVASCDKFALLFGTADYWNNYSITSSPCRMYAELMKAGFTPENIIFMSFKQNYETYKNPWPKKMFTAPAETTDGDWAQYGCFTAIDYTQTTITEEVFLAILSGDAETVKAKTGKENPKVLNAGPDDTVFTYFIDHGDDGIICVGTDYVRKDKFMSAIKTAHEKKLYGRWVWYMEACHSGSMWGDLPSDWNIYVMTSSDATHDADMSNCPPDDIVAGKEIKACMSGLWDNSFMDYIEEHPKASIGEIFDSVKADVMKTSEQNVSEFGDMTFRELPLSEFIGLLPNNYIRQERKVSQSNVEYSQVPLHLAKWNAIRATEENKKDAMKKYAELSFVFAKREVEVMRLGKVMMSEKAVEQAKHSLTKSYSIDCYRDLMLALVNHCGHTIPLPPATSSILRSICLPGITTPNVNWEDICFCAVSYRFNPNDLFIIHSLYSI